MLSLAALCSALWEVALHGVTPPVVVPGLVFSVVLGGVFARKNVVEIEEVLLGGISTGGIGFAAAILMERPSGSVAWLGLIVIGFMAVFIATILVWSAAYVRLLVRERDRT